MSKQKKPTKKPKVPPAGAQANGVSLARHPRAQRQIRKARAWGALAAFALAAYSSWHAAAPFVDSVLRGLLWGVVAYVLVWFAAQQVWRHLAIAEVRAAEKLVAQRRAEALAARSGEVDAGETMVLQRDGGG